MAAWEFIDCRENASTKDLQAVRVQLRGGSVHVMGTLHSGAKNISCAPGEDFNSVVYRDILRDTLVPFSRQIFGDNFRYQVDNDMLHPSRVVTQYLQKRDIDKWTSLNNPIEDLWGELGRTMNKMDHPQHNLHKLCQALLDQWASVSLERLQCQVASILCWLAAIIIVMAGNTRY